MSGDETRAPPPRPRLRRAVHRVVPTPMPLILASASPARAEMLTAAAVPFEAVPARVDEAAIREGLAAEGAAPRDVADALAEAKARKVAGRRPDALVIGCDQVLDLDGEVLGKPGSPEEARAQIGRLAGRTHRLHSAAVAYADGAPAWRQVEGAVMTMRTPSEAWLDGYVARNWGAVRGSVGGYVIEGEGVRLFASVRGDGFAIRGMPLLPLLNWLTTRGEIAG